MALLAIAIPILPGKTEQTLALMGSLGAGGDRHREFAESRRRLNIHERTFLQQTPHGDLVIVTLEGDDPAGAFQKFAQGDDEFTRWFLQQVQEVHGMDLSSPPPGPLPQLMVDSGA